MKKIIPFSLFKNDFNKNEEMKKLLKNIKELIQTGQTFGNRFGMYGKEADYANLYTSIFQILKNRGYLEKEAIWYSFIPKTTPQMYSYIVNTVKIPQQTPLKQLKGIFEDKDTYNAIWGRYQRFLLKQSYHCLQSYQDWRAFTREYVIVESEKELKEELTKKGRKNIWYVYIGNKHASHRYIDFSKLPKRPVITVKGESFYFGEFFPRDLLIKNYPEVSTDEVTPFLLKHGMPINVLGVSE